MEPLDFHGGVADGDQPALEVRSLPLLDADVFERAREGRSLRCRLLRYLRAMVAGPVLQVLDLLQARLVLCARQNLL